VWGYDRLGGVTATRVLYAIVCGSPAARGVGRLVEMAQAAGWDVCVVATPDGLKWLDVPQLVERTGHPVRHRFKSPDEADVLPPPDAIVVAPATVNTVNKWAAGIADTLALGLVVEGYGLGLPMVVIPFTNAAMATHPAFLENVERLRSWGVTVLLGDDVVRLHPPRTGNDHLHKFPWHLALQALEERMPQ
jgi:hypothetical protein